MLSACHRTDFQLVVPQSHRVAAVACSDPLLCLWATFEEMRKRMLGATEMYTLPFPWVPAKGNAGMGSLRREPRGMV